jgi:cell division protein FtsQ
LHAPTEEAQFDDGSEPVLSAGRTEKQRAGAAARGSLWEKLLAALKLGAGLALVVATSLSVAYSVRHYALTSPRFALAEVALEGGKRIAVERAKELAGLALGTNLFALDTEAAERKLLQSPWIAQARVRRELPRRLRIDLVEREPAALALLGDRLYLVTPKGEPFKPLESGEPSDFAIITGVSVAALAENRGSALLRLAQGIEILETYQKLPLAKQWPAQEVHLADSGDAVLTIGKDGITLELGKLDYRRKLLMAAQVVEELRRKGRSPGIVFLDNQAHPERVVVRMK